MLTLGALCNNDFVFALLLLSKLLEEVFELEAAATEKIDGVCTAGSGRGKVATLSCTELTGAGVSSAADCDCATRDTRALTGVCSGAAGGLWR